MISHVACFSHITLDHLTTSNFRVLGGSSAVSSGRKPAPIIISHAILIRFSYISHTGDTHGAPWTMLRASGGANFIINSTFRGILNFIEHLDFSS